MNGEGRRQRQKARGYMVGWVGYFVYSVRGGEGSG